jgi:hypothetical protein
VLTISGILIPVAYQVNSSAKTLRCPDNMRLTDQSRLTYKNDSQGFNIVPFDVNKNGTWQKLLIDYDGIIKQLTSELEHGKNTDYGIWRYPENKEQSRIVSGAFIGEQGRYGINGWSNLNQTQGRRYTGARVAAMRHPAELYMLTEACYFRFEEHIGILNKSRHADSTFVF